MRANVSALALAFAAVVLGACSTAAEEGPERAEGRRGSGLGDLLDRSLEAKRQGGARPALDEGARELPAGWRQKIDAWWNLFLRDQPEWPEARQRWLALESPGPEILVENLIRWYILAFDAGDRFQVNRARLELQAVPAVARPYLIDGLARSRADSVVRARCEDLLVELSIDDPKPIEEAFEDADAEGRFALTRAVRKIGHRSSIPFLMARARGEGLPEVPRNDIRFLPVKIRIEAIRALGELKAAPASPVLLAALADSDPSVRKFSAHYLPAVAAATPPVLEGLIACMERALADGDSEIARTCQGALQRLLGRDLGLRPADWRAAARARGA